MYLLQKLMRALGSGNLDHRLRQMDFSDQDGAPLYPSLGQSIEHLEHVDAAFVIGSDLRRQQPLLAHRLRKAALNGASMMFLSALESAYQFPVVANIAVDPRGMTYELAAVAKVLLKLASVTPPNGFADAAKSVQPSAQHEAIAQALKNARNATVLLGTDAMHHADFATLRALASLIAQLTDAKLGYLSDGANAAGAWLAGMLPHRGPSGAKPEVKGLNALEMMRQKLKGYVLLGIEPDRDCADVRAATKALHDAAFVVALTAFRGPAVDQCASVLLPIAPFNETSGTFVNAEGRWQSFAGAVAPLGEARPAWKVLRVLGNVMRVEGFEYLSSEEARDELQNRVGNAHPDNKTAWHPPKPFVSSPQGLTRIAQVAPYAVDAIVRRAEPLQQTADAPAAAAYVSPEQAAQLSIRDGQMVALAQGADEITMPARFDHRVPRGCVLVYAGQPGAEQLDPSATLTVRGI
jgi:NADH-quinone oxidoreductase subunit G